MLERAGAGGGAGAERAVAGGELVLGEPVLGKLVLGMPVLGMPVLEEILEAAPAQSLSFSRCCADSSCAAFSSPGL